MDRKSVFAYFIMLATVVILCASCGRMWRDLDPLVHTLATMPVAAGLYYTGTIMEFLSTHARAMETEDIGLFASLFTSDFRSSSHADLDSLKEETGKFFSGHDDIEVDFSDMEAEITIPEISLEDWMSIEKGEPAQQSSTEDQLDPFGEWLGEPPGPSLTGKYKVSVKTLEN